MIRVSKLFFAICVFFTLSACGGGGGDSSLSLTYSPAIIEASGYEWDFPQSVEFNAIVHGSTSASSVYILVADPGNTFSAGPIGLESIGPNTYKVTMRVPAGDAVGAHNGNLSIKICSDSACHSVLNDSTLPYQVTVNANPSLQAVASPTVLSGSAISGGSTQYGSELVPVSWKLPTFTLQGTPVYPVYVRASDPDGVMRLLTDVYSAAPDTAGPFNADTLQLAFAITNHLAVGNYSGTLSFTLCHDPQCTKVFNGTSTLPYVLSYSSDHLTALTPIANAPDWQGIGGGADHGGNVPITVASDALLPRWTAHSGSSSDTDPGPLTGKDHVYFMVGSGVVALKESDGTQAWYKPFVNSPDGMVGVDNAIYVRSFAYGDYDSVLYGLNKTDGSQLFATTVRYGSSAPVAIGNQVLFQVSDPTIGYPQFHGFDGQTGIENGTPDCLKAIEQATHLGSGLLPALDAQLNAYIPSSAGLVVANFGSSPGCHQIPASLTSSQAVLIKGNSNVLVGNGASLIDLGTLNSAINWSLGGLSITQSPVVANGVVYLATYNSLGSLGTSRAQVQARSEVDGHLLWVWNSPDLSLADFTGNLIVTNNLIFAQVNKHVYAIDLASHQAVWTLNVGGPMAISANGILYINGMDYMTAVNLH